MAAVPAAETQPLSLSRRLLLSTVARCLAAGLATGLAFAPASAGAAPAPVRYRISDWNPQGRTFRVRVETQAAAPVTLALSRWVPGYYQLQSLREALVRMSATVDGRSAALVETPDRWRWTVAAAAGQRVAVEYTVLAQDPPTSRGMGQAFVDGDSAFVLPAACLLRVVGQEQEPCEVEVEPLGAGAVAAPLPERGGRFLADGWDQLADSPLETGNLRFRSFTQHGVPYRIVTTGKPAVSMDNFTYLARRAAATVPRFFGSTPYPDYTFFAHFGSGGGSVTGLEHARCTTLAYGGPEGMSNANFRGQPASLIFHELFHAWNAKAMRPASLTPYNYDAVPRTRTLWLAEGFTTYYGYLLTRRSGVWSEEELLWNLGREYGRYLRSPGRRVTSLFDASEFTWEDRIYGEGRGASYYTKGALAALVLDLRLRKGSAGTRSLDDVMRWLYRRYGPAAGYPDDVLPRAVRESTGYDLTAEIRRLTEGATDLPVPSVLADLGYRVILGDLPRVTPLAKVSPEARRLRDEWLRVEP